MARAIWPAFENVHARRIFLLAMWKANNYVSRTIAEGRALSAIEAPAGRQLAIEEVIDPSSPGTLAEVQRILADPRFRNVQVTISKQEIRQHTKQYGNRALQGVMKAMEELQGLKIELRDEVDIERFSKTKEPFQLKAVVMPTIAVQGDEMLIEFHPIAAAQLMGLQKNFSLWQVQEFMALSSVQQQSLFPIIASYAHQEGMTLDLSFVRSVLGIAPETYPTWNEFRKSVLNSVVGAISRKTSFKVKATPVRRAGKVVQVRFDIARTDRNLDPLGRALAAVLKIEGDIPLSRAITYIRTRGVNFCRDCLAYVLYRKDLPVKEAKPLASTGAFMTALLQKDEAPKPSPAGMQAFLYAQERVVRELAFQLYLNLPADKKKHVNASFESQLENDAHRRLWKDLQYRHHTTRTLFLNFLGPLVDQLVAIYPPDEDDLALADGVSEAPR